MEPFKEEFEHLKIPLQDITLATNTFDEAMSIGSGGFGNVYKGELAHYKGRSMVAIKRLNPKHGQGSPEFWKEIRVLNDHTHENLITLLGFCIEDGEMILVYEYASNGSLDRHITSTNFTWTQRLKTCLGAARGLNFLHDAKGTNERVIHRDVKSANILLDANWNTKVADMGLSRIAPANQQYTGVYTQPLGTPGYCDPLYVVTYNLTKESDVYSFGVVLFEVLCGRLCCDYENGRIVKDFVPMWKERYEQNKVQEIIFYVLKQQMDPNALKTYSNIAFQCMQISREARPLMSSVVKELETALAQQELYERFKLPTTDPLNDRSESELHNGILVNNGTTWLSRKNGYYCEMISIAECLIYTAIESRHFVKSPEYTSRFAVGFYEPRGEKMVTHIKAQFLSPHITYAVNLVCTRKGSKGYHLGLEYKLVGEEGRSHLFVSDRRDDGWLTVELFQFISDQKTVELEIMFYTHRCPNLQVESIEFLPLEKVEHEALIVETVDMQPEPDTESYWEQNLPINYEEIIKWSLNGVRWKSKKELYYILCEGFLINGSKEWFSIAKDGKKCVMLPAKSVLKEKEWEWNLKPETRFGQVAVCTSTRFSIICKFSSKMLSPQITYAAYLVYKGQPHGHKDTYNPPLQVVDVYSSSEEAYNVFVSTPKTPVINLNEAEEEKTFNPSRIPMTKGLPKLRSDGWMEVQVHEFQTPATITTIYAHLRFFSYDVPSLKGITMQGVEFRPI